MLMKNISKIDVILGDVHNGRHAEGTLSIAPGQTMEISDFRRGCYSPKDPVFKRLVPAHRAERAEAELQLSMEVNLDTSALEGTQNAPLSTSDLAKLTAKHAAKAELSQAEKEEKEQADLAALLASTVKTEK